MSADDITAWLGRPGSVPSLSQIEGVGDHSPLSAHPTNSRESFSEASNEIHQISDGSDHDASSPSDAPDIDAASDVDTGSAGSMSKSATIPRKKVTINLPPIRPRADEEYEYLPNHFEVDEVIEEYQGGKVLVRLGSLEKELMTVEKVKSLGNGATELARFRARNVRGVRKPAAAAFNDLRMFDSAESDSDESQDSPRKRTKLVETGFADGFDDNSEDDEQSLSDQSQDIGRRSSRLAATRKKAKYVAEVIDLDGSDSDSDNAPRRKSSRTTGNAKQAAIKLKSNQTRVVEVSRRSERTRNVPRRNMRERQEDEISSASEEEVGPKIISTKEIFFKLAEDHPFRKRHRPVCDTCAYTGDTREKGPLIFCQGCTNSHHKECLGSRGTRDHLVTKVGDTLFVLQCRRCVGVHHDKDALAPHLGHCSLPSCDKPGPNSIPFRPRLTTRQEQLQREENGGQDPITVVDQRTINNIDYMMYRCATCQRAWHMHHLPKRDLMMPQGDGNGDDSEDHLTKEQLAQRRFDVYHRSWICKDCIEHQNQIDAIVAWRPIDIDLYVPGTTVDQMPESQKEYLLKWRSQSHLRVKWMAATWVWGVAASTMRIAWVKKEENSMPKMTTKDAIPEDFLRTDIVFDVRYSSVVRNSSKEIDMVRAKEVESAFVKYKGLGYEDSIWEKPPLYSDKERWMDFKQAYEDYVAKVYLGIPVQSTLRRHLTAVRSQDFERLAKTTQPAGLTGGQLMQYQLEGLNWLYWQWYRGQNAILADEMGLGKTIQLVAFFANMVQEHKCWPFLVVVPNSTCPNWRREIQKWAPSLRVVMYYGSERARKLTHDFELFPKDKEKEKQEESKVRKPRTEVKDMRAHIVVASYESVVEEKTRKSLLRVPWQGLIVDEGQRLKNDKNLVYDCLSKFNFPFKVLLTGTPLQNNPRELFNLLQFLDKSKNAAELEAKYAELTQENVPELHELLRPFFLRRTKVQVLTFLPPMAQIIVPITMSTVQKRVAKSILSQNPHLMKSIFSRDREHIAAKDRINLNNILMQLRKTLCHPFVYNRDIEERNVDKEASHRGLVEASAKLQLLQLMLPKLKERGHRVLLFSQFLANLDIMEDFLDGMGMLHRRLDGNINALEKQKRIDDFNAPDSPYFAFLLSTRAGGVGINLATADTVIILDPDFNPHQDIQALSRAHRIGQKNKVLVFQLMTKNSAEEKIMAIGKKKMALDHVLIERMDNGDDVGESLESILKFGAAALFEDQNEDDVVYDSASIDKLLDRSQMESTKISEDQSAESQFSFARIWSNDKATLEDGLQDSIAETKAPDSSIWDAILIEREKAYEEEQTRKAEVFGRGKRKRGQVDYKPDADQDKANILDGGDGIISDDEFSEANVDEAASSSSSESDSDAHAIQTIKARPFRRVKVPIGAAPHFNGEGPSGYIPMGGLPPLHPCTVCHESHPMGWCRLKIAGVEYCGLCNLAHIGHGRTCPNLNDEKQVEILLQSLKESTESREIIDETTKYLRLIRSDLVSRRRAREKKETESRTFNSMNGKKRLYNLQSTSNSYPVTTAPVGNSSSNNIVEAMNGFARAVSNVTSGLRRGGAMLNIENRTATTNTTNGARSTSETINPTNGSGYGPANGGSSSSSRSDAFRSYQPVVDSFGKPLYSQPRPT